MVFNRIANKESSELGKQENGFSLVELMVTVSIIGILAVVGTISFNSIQEQAMKQQATVEPTETPQDTEQPSTSW